jgi:hypothetical protein
MQQLDALCFTRAEEAHGSKVHKHHILQVQYDRWAVASDVCHQFLQMVRLNPATQPENGAVALGPFLDSERHHQEGIAIQVLEARAVGDSDAILRSGG